MPAQITSPLRRRLERIYPGQNNSVNTYRILSHSNENEIDEYDEIHEPETRHDRVASQQPLRERPQNLINLPRRGRPLSEILGGSNTAAGQNTRRSVRLAAKATTSTPARLLHQAGAPRDHVEEKEEDEEDQIVVVPRKRTRGARKIVLDSDDEEKGEDKDVDGGVSPPIRVARPLKRLRRRRVIQLHSPLAHQKGEEISPLAALSRLRQFVVLVAQIASQNLVRVTLIIKTLMLKMTTTRRWILEI
jgi:hypothetical protein